MGKTVKGHVVIPENAERPPLEAPEHVEVTKAMGEQLLRESITLTLTPRCHGLLQSLLQMPAQFRLALNLKMTGLFLASNDAGNDPVGLDNNEIAALYEVESSRLSTEARQTAWSLFDVPARKLFVAAFRESFIRARLFEKKKTKSGE